eukprot:CAMPEP_0194286216 /NCGR_PEP_ID=MMETSP0169-20130528/32061_1 /TAXON_ID=218684 /ORGANISM="Corethron pennatum, Strain L29A3" /LENGTH=203 /DNA_ID=CAMNT_0039032589 /DNA_START=36 /DNA_END=647 /DNA_ORIENTATION=-
MSVHCLPSPHSRAYFASSPLFTLLFLLGSTSTWAWAPSRLTPPTYLARRPKFCLRLNHPVAREFQKSDVVLRGANSDEGTGDNGGGSGKILLAGAAGTAAAFLVLYSEYTLKSTGCGLPAGPFGIVGATEGISYLSVVGISAYSAVVKFRSGSGLQAGPYGLLGAAEGLSYLAILAGIIVLGFQIADYGFIPNAVPMQGGMCK